MSDYYDRAGNPMSLMDWAQKVEDRSYVRVVETTLPDGKWISTIWLGLDYSFNHGSPMIFETMVFPHEGQWGDLDARRYTTEEQARTGHAEMVAKWSNPVSLQEEIDRS